MQVSSDDWGGTYGVMKPPYVNGGDTAGVSREGHGVAEKCAPASTFGSL